MIKRNGKQRKAYKKMLKHLDMCLGEQDAGLFLAICCDLLDRVVKDTDYLELRTLELKINNFFSIKYDFEQDRVVE